MHEDVHDPRLNSRMPSLRGLHSCQFCLHCCHLGLLRSQSRLGRRVRRLQSRHPLHQAMTIAKKRPLHWLAHRSSRYRIFFLTIKRAPTADCLSCLVTPPPGAIPKGEFVVLLQLPTGLLSELATTAEHRP